MIDNDLAREFEKTADQIVAGAYVVEIAGQCYTVVGYDTTCPECANGHNRQDSTRPAATAAVSS